MTPQRSRRQKEIRTMACEVPEDEPILQCVERMVDTFRRSPQTELEVRLGTIKGNTFESGVTFDYSSELYNAMTDAASLKVWDRAPVVSNFMYRYFSGDVRGTYSLKEAAKFFRVRRVAHADVRCENRAYDLRFSLKTETPLEDYSTNETAQMVRVNTRCSIQHEQTFVYDFTKTGQGLSTDKACQNYSVMVELELLRNEEYLSKHKNREIAVSLLGRARDLLGRYNASGTMEALSLTLSNEEYFE